MPIKTGAAEISMAIRRPATVRIGTVRTGTPAEVTNSGTSTDAVLDFVLPAGAKGEKGDPSTVPGPVGPPGPAGAPGAGGAQGPSGVSTVTPSLPSRVLGTAFQPSSTKAVAASYAVKIVIPPSNPTINHEAKVELLSGAVNPPTTVRDVVGMSAGGFPTSTSSQTSSLRYMVPAGHYVLLKSTVVSGSPTVTLVSQCEETLG